MFTDIVESTQAAERLGDRAWRDLLDRPDLMTERQVLRFGGHLVKATGDGALATFDGPRPAPSGVPPRSVTPSHSSESPSGVESTRVRSNSEATSPGSPYTRPNESALRPRPGETLVSRTVADLAAGSEIAFVDRGEHELKGIPGTWRLFAVDG